MKKHLREDFKLIKISMQDVEIQILTKLKEIESLQETKKKESINP